MGSLGPMGFEPLGGLWGEHVRRLHDIAPRSVSPGRGARAQGAEHASRLCVVQSEMKCQDGTPQQRGPSSPWDTCCLDSGWLHILNPRGGHPKLDSLIEGLDVFVTVARLPESGLLSSVSCRMKRKSWWSVACGFCPSWASGRTSIHLPSSWTLGTSASSATFSGANLTPLTCPRRCRPPAW